MSIVSPLKPHSNTECRLRSTSLLERHMPFCQRTILVASRWELSRRATSFSGIVPMPVCADLDVSWLSPGNKGWIPTVPCGMSRFSAKQPSLLFEPQARNHQHTFLPRALLSGRWMVQLENSLFPLNEIGPLQVLNSGWTGLLLVDKFRSSAR